MNSIGDSLFLAAALIFNVDVELMRIVGLSLRVSATACVIGAVVGLWLGAWLAVARFPGYRAAVWLLNTLLALPAVVVGLVVYLLLSRAGPAGAAGHPVHAHRHGHRAEHPGGAADCRAVAPAGAECAARRRRPAALDGRRPVAERAADAGARTLPAC